MNDEVQSKTWVTWGYGRSWIVIESGPGGQVLWRSDWFRSRQAAERLVEHLRNGGSHQIFVPVPQPRQHFEPPVQHLRQAG